MPASARRAQRVLGLGHRHEVELDVLPRRDVALAAAEPLGDVGERLELRGRRDAGGQLRADHHHAVLALAVDAVEQAERRASRRATSSPRSNASRRCDEQIDVFVAREAEAADGGGSGRSVTLMTTSLQLLRACSLAIGVASATTSPTTITPAQLGVERRVAERRERAEPARRAGVRRAEHDRGGRLGRPAARDQARGERGARAQAHQHDERQRAGRERVDDRRVRGLARGRRRPRSPAASAAVRDRDAGERGRGDRRADSPGTTSYAMPAASSASASSPPRPSTNGSPHLRRTTRSPRCAARIIRRVDAVLLDRVAAGALADVEPLRLRREREQRARATSAS